MTEVDEDECTTFSDVTAADDGKKIRPWARNAARCIVRYPWTVVLCCFVPVLLSLLALYFVPLYVDTGVNSFYARQTPVANRINSLILVNTVLPSTASNVTGAPLEPNVRDLVQWQPSNNDGSVFKPEDRFAELHVLAQAKHGDIFEPDVLRTICNVKAAVFAEQTRLLSCYPKRPPLPAAGPPTNDTASNNGTNVAEESPAPSGAAAAVPAAPRANASDGNATETTAEAAALGPSEEGEDELECRAPFSIFAVHDAIKDAGYEPHLLLVRAFAAVLEQQPQALTLARAACAAPASERARVLCKFSAGGLDGGDNIGVETPFVCAPGPCANDTAPRCMFQGIDPCTVLNEVAPSVEEVRAIAALPSAPLDANGCDDIDMTGLADTLAAFRVMSVWSTRSEAFQELGLLPNALLEEGYLERNASAVTRVVFGMPKVSDAADSLDVQVAQYAAEVAALHANSQVTFSWRAFHYFDVYSSHALVRDVCFAFGALAFLILYTWSQVVSLSLTLLIVLGIIVSYPLTLALYSVILGIRWIGVLHFLGIFVILGIGADDVYVVLEHWRHSMKEASVAGSMPSTERRLAWTVQHSLVSITATSFTTISAFAANMTSSITPTRLFGLFMVILVLVNYVFVLTNLLAVLVLRERAAARSARRGGARREAGRDVYGDVSVSVDLELEMQPLDTCSAAGSPVDREEPVTPRLHSVRGDDDDTPSVWTVDEKHSGTARAGAVDTTAAPPDNTDGLRGNVVGASRLSKHQLETGTVHREAVHGEAPASSSNASEGRPAPQDAGDTTGTQRPGVASLHAAAGRSEGGTCRDEHSPAASPSGAGAWTAAEDVGPLLEPRSAGPCASSARFASPFCWPELAGKRSRLGLAAERLADCCGVGRCWRRVTHWQRLWCSNESEAGAARVHNFLGGPYADFVYEARWVVVLVTAAAVLYFGWCATRLQLPNSRPSVWRPGSNYNTYWSMEEMFTFGRAQERIEMQLVWGVHPQDTGSLNAAYERGEAVLDTTANMTARDSQTTLQRICDVLAELEAEGRVVQGSLRCPMDLVRQIADVRGLGFPMAPQDFEETLRTYSYLTDGVPNYARVKFGTAAMLARRPATVLARAHTLALHPDLDPGAHGWDRYSLSDAAPEAWSVGPGAGSWAFMPRPWWWYDKFTDDPVNYTVPVTFSIEFTLHQTWVGSFESVKAVWQRWDDFMHVLLQEAPAGLRNGFQTSDAWRVMEQEAVVFESGRLSLLLSMLLAFATLVAVTRNFLLAALACACMVIVVVIFMGAMQLLGWTLGIIECVCVAIMVGLSVDYIVHMATSLAHCGLRGRAAVAYSLRTVGMSVVSGAVTTIGASVFLLFCEMNAFLQFGTIVIITLFAATLCALLVFPALCCVAWGDLAAAVLKTRQALEAARASSRNSC